ncbi:hypothetical protein [Burkholderia vietnamiensis]|uniref:hypothetical protein n=1 Tax=Burkholderia vietnamiensis TaxID=60552 RepID=UPI0012DAD5A2|nr:hypothetical protein [Burkholderia vietnamiensis]
MEQWFERRKHPQCCLHDAARVRSTDYPKKTFRHAGERIEVPDLAGTCVRSIGIHQRS